VRLPVHIIRGWFDLSMSDHARELSCPRHGMLAAVMFERIGVRRRQLLAEERRSDVRDARPAISHVVRLLHRNLN